MGRHLVKSYDEELRCLRDMVVVMGELTEQQLDAMVNAAERADSSLAERGIEREPEADRLEHQIDNAAVRMLALRQPVAVDVRHVLAALWIAHELERTCDHAEDMARRLTAARSNTVPLHSLISLARFAVTMVKDALRAYIDEDVQLAQAVWNRDKEHYSSLFGELLTDMMEEPRRISATAQALFMARGIERTGDRATNIAEMVRYLVGGVPVEEERPKADATKSMIVPAIR